MSVRSVQQAFWCILEQLSGIFKGEKEPKPKEMHQQDQQNFENRIACGICLEPRLRMVTGNCQHRFCVHCVYDTTGTRRVGLERCPSCQLDHAFPVRKPVIPEDLIEIQRALGVGSCDRCGEEMWLRELSEHHSTCTKESPSSSSKGTKSRTISPNSSCQEGQKKRRPRGHARGSEVKMLLADLGTGVTTRSRSSPRCMQELDGYGTSKRKQRTATKARSHSHPYSK